MPPPTPTAADRTVRQTLELLDGPFAGFGAAFNRGEYALWLGSGISRERVAALNGVLSKIIEFLRTRVTANANCPFRQALDQIIDLAEPSDIERGRISYAVDSAMWPDRTIILKRLAGKYADVLNVSVVGRPDADYLLWEAADFTNTFANQEPDAEHLCVGILALEGVVSDIATANWDGLLEAAIRELGHAIDVYRICVRGNDFQGAATAAKLLKFHGCAIRAIADEAVYRPLLIARHAQIIDWANNNNFLAVKHALVAMAAHKRTLMVGMSAQDNNIQTLYSDARNLATWQWNDPSPAHVFAEQTLSGGQTTILQVSYGADYHPNQQAIGARSCIQAYGKALLCSLVLNMISSKCSALMRSATAPNLHGPDYATLDTGIRRIRDLVAELAGADAMNFVRRVALHLSRVKSMLQEGRRSAAAPQKYNAISTRHDIENDANIGATGQREAASGLALLGLGEIAGDWELGIGNLLANEAGAIRVKSKAGEARVIFVANSNADLQLFSDGIYSEDDGNVVLLHSSPVVPKQQRSPSNTLGRAGKKTAVHLDVSEVLGAATDLSDLKIRFRQGIGL